MTIEISKHDLSKLFESEKDVFLDHGGSCENLLSLVTRVHCQRVFGEKNKGGITIEDMKEAIKMERARLVQRCNKINDKPPWGMYT